MTRSHFTLTTLCDADFWLGGTLCGGQCFRWNKDRPDLGGLCYGNPDSGGMPVAMVNPELTEHRCNAHTGSYTGVIGGRLITLSQHSSDIVIEGDEQPDAVAFWRRYLDLDTDYGSIRDGVLALEPRLAAASARCGGIHILNQEPWEALCSFIISQNNNIPRIRQIVERLCLLCGEPVADSAGAPFPSAESVAALSEQQLTDIGCGYRAGYIIGAARLVTAGTLNLEELRRMPLCEARARLLEVRGIGPKVADCALLFGLHRLECFPRDVWINRALSGDFANTPLLDSPYAGVAQQYIFEYMRMRSE